MDSELKILKKIFEENGRAHIESISDYLGFGRDYLRFLCQRLVEKDLLISSQRDWYQLSKKGKRELKLRGLIDLRKKRLKRHLKKIVLPTLRLREFPKKIKSAPNFTSSKNYNPPTLKLKLGKKIEKTASSLTRARQSQAKGEDEVRTSSTEKLRS